MSRDNQDQDQEDQNTHSQGSHKSSQSEDVDVEFKQFEISGDKNEIRETGENDQKDKK